MKVGLRVNLGGDFLGCFNRYKMYITLFCTIGFFRDLFSAAQNEDYGGGYKRNRKFVFHKEAYFS